MRDYQQSRVYAWEHKWVRPRVDDRISFDTAVAVGNHIWSELGLQYPPQFKPLAKQTTRWAGKANRLSVWLPETTSTYTVIHEIAHSLTSDNEGNSARHGPEFTGVLCQLLDRFTPLSIFELWFSAEQANVDVNRFARFLIVN